MNQIIAERIGPSAQLGVQALIFGTVVGVALGTLAGLRQNTWIDYSSMAVAILSMSLPNFVLAAFLSYFVGVKLGWLPVALWEGFEYTILPTLTLSGTVIAMLARFMRTEMIEVLGQDYIKTAKAKGLSPSAVVWKHTIRHAMLPSVTVLRTIAINIVTGSLVIEQMFGVPGIGEQFVTSIHGRRFDSDHGRDHILQRPLYSDDLYNRCSVRRHRSAHSLVGGEGIRWKPNRAYTTQKTFSLLTSLTGTRSIESLRLLCSKTGGTS